MIAILNVCQRDRDQALRLLQWIATLGGCARHDLILQFSQGIKRAGMHTELEDAARPIFASISTVFPYTEDERGWPHSANHAWMNALQLVREKLQKPWLWLEADCFPLERAWFDKIEAEYVKGAKPFMGAEVRQPSHRMSGIGVYPPMVVAYFKRIFLGDLVREEAFDSFFASQIVPNAHFTTLIQNVWSTEPGKDVAPTFPDADSLGLIDSRAVLFHRCKNQSLFDRFTEHRQPPISSGETVSIVSHKHDSVGSTPIPATTPKRGKRGKKKRAPMSSERRAQLIASIAKAREAKKNKVLA